MMALEAGERQSRLHVRHNPCRDSSYTRISSVLTVSGLDSVPGYVPIPGCSVFVPELAVSLLGQGAPICPAGEQEPGNSLTNTLH